DVSDSGRDRVFVAISGTDAVIESFARLKSGAGDTHAAARRTVRASVITVCATFFSTANNTTIAARKICFTAGLPMNSSRLFVRRRVLATPQLQTRLAPKNWIRLTFTKSVNSLLFKGQKSQTSNLTANPHLKKLPSYNIFCFVTAFVTDDETI
ncbi:MAG TPA: hypothetical protein VMB22_07055, partial [Verrucomicrobiae bacterium]|nr:hypothetical protein [Verrucomicrobiae bacterium]